jgi:hypothetical protein
MTKLSTITAAVLSLIPAACFGQNGTDINDAIPIYFGQTINGAVDGSSTCCQVYSLKMAAGQKLTLTAKATATNPAWGVCLEAPSVTTIEKSSCVAGGGATNATAITYDYTAAAAGTYYLDVFANANRGTAYTFQVNAVNGILPTTPPVKAGCLSGQVDSITYSLQLIAAHLPDAVSIGGTQTCPTCSVKPPAYPALVEKLETAMARNVGVSACFDPSGNIFELTLNHP